MNHLIFIHLLAQGYSCEAYGANAYGECSSTTSPTSPTANDPAGFLANTGYDILLPLALGVAIVIAAIILAIKTLRRRQEQ